MKLKPFLSMAFTVMLVVIGSLNALEGVSRSEVKDVEMVTTHVIKALEAYKKHETPEMKAHHKEMLDFVVKAIETHYERKSHGSQDSQDPDIKDGVAPEDPGVFSEVMTKTDQFHMLVQYTCQGICKASGTCKNGIPITQDDIKACMAALEDSSEVTIINSCAACPQVCNAFKPFGDTCQYESVRGFCKQLCCNKCPDKLVNCLPAHGDKCQNQQ